METKMLIKLCRLEHTSDGHNKFWEMFDQGEGNYWCQWGKIGAKPQGDSYPKATAEKRKREKLAKGYREVELKESAPIAEDMKAELEFVGSKTFLDDLSKI